MMTSIRSEDRLEGSSNFNNWKARIIAILEEHNLDHCVTTIVVEPTSSVGRASFKRNQAKVLQRKNPPPVGKKNSLAEEQLFP